MKYVVWGLVLGLVVLHQDVWFWDDGKLVFGFFPITLLYHAGISFAAGFTWFLATKFALLDRRVEFPYHPRLEKELINLEVDTAKDKVDHPPHGSKDIADAVAGVVFGLCRQKVTWLSHGQSTARMNDYAQRFIKEEKPEVDPETESYMQVLKRLQHTT